MALTVGTNSYISVADADLYFADRLNSAVWTGAVAVGLKDQALIQASQIINNKQFVGIRTVPTQSLSFPRAGVYLDSVLLDSSVVPKNVIDATCELAIWLLQSDYTEPDALSQFGKVQLGPIAVETKTSSSTSVAKKTPPMVNDLLRPFTISTFNLVRG